VDIRNLHWGREEALGLGKQFDFILGSDIIYIKDSFPLLLDTILALSTTTTKTLIASTNHGNLD